MKAALFLLLAAAPAFAQGPTVFINGDQGVSANGSVFALGGLALGGTSAGKHDKTSEVARVLLKSCPEVSLTLDQSNPHLDYLLLLTEESESFGGKSGQIMLLRPDKSVLFASKEKALSRAIKDGCKAILADWRDHRPLYSSHSDTPSPWNVTNAAPAKDAKQ